MILIFGGSYNGKIAFVKDTYKIKDDEIFYCKDETLNFDKKVICGLHIFTRQCALNSINSLDILQNNIEKFKGKIIICDEIGSGIVPMEKEDRRWREDNGKALQFLTLNSTKVIRIFFGFPEVLKE